jgi:antitoxin component YwqK of YwqJK toxin-antitoxin module
VKKYLIVIVLLLQACTTEPKLQSQAIKTEVHPPLFERVWKNGKSELEGDRKIIRSEGRYTYDIIPEKNGKKDGTMRRYDKKSKKILFETVYKNGIHNGWARKYSPEGGWLYEETLYVNGSKDEVREYNKKGEMVHSTPYLNEKKHGVEQKFSYISGDLKYRLTHDHGTVKKLVTYCKGKPKVEMQLDGCRHGVERVWYCGTTILEREIPYLNCKKNGLEKKYDKQGNLLYVITYRNNLKEGSAKVYYPDGRIKYLLVYHNDKPDEMAWYYSATNKKERIDYNTLQRFSERFPKGFEYWWQAL